MKFKKNASTPRSVEVLTTIIQKNSKKMKASTPSTDEEEDFKFFKDILFHNYFQYLAEKEQKEHQTTTREGDNPYTLIHHKKFNHNLSEHDKIQHVNTRVQQQIGWRRSKVLEYLSQGMSQTEISNLLQFDKSTISLDVSYLRKMAKERIRHLIEDRLPLEFERSLLS